MCRIVVALLALLPLASAAQPTDPDDRRMMRFEDLTAEETAMREAAVRLVRLRRDRPALRHGHLETLHSDAGTWVYLRATPADAVLAFLDKGTRTRTLRMDLPPPTASRQLPARWLGNPSRSTTAPCRR